MSLLLLSTLRRKQKITYRVIPVVRKPYDPRVLLKKTEFYVKSFTYSDR